MLSLLLKEIFDICACDLLKILICLFAHLFLFVMIYFLLNYINFFLMILILFYFLYLFFFLKLLFKNLCFIIYFFIYFGESLKCFSNKIFFINSVSETLGRILLWILSMKLLSQYSLLLNFTKLS